MAGCVLFTFGCILGTVIWLSFQLYELSDDPKRKEFLDDLFSFMQKRGESQTLQSSTTRCSDVHHRLRATADREAFTATVSMSAAHMLVSCLSMLCSAGDDSDHKPQAARPGVCAQAHDHRCIAHQLSNNPVLSFYNFTITPHGDS